MESVNAPVVNHRVGVMLVGSLGMTGTAVLGGICAIKKEIVAEEYGTTSLPDFARVPLVSAKVMEVGGWDYRSSSVSQVAERYGHLPEKVAASIQDKEVMLFPGLWTPAEYPLEHGREFVRCPSSLAEGASMVCEDIECFRSRTGCDRIVVLFVGTPARDTALTPEAFRLPDSGRTLTPSGIMYAVGAADAGAHFIDFTPSRTLEFIDIWRHAETQGVQIAGRDGSTGQTMLKATLAEMLARRGVKIDAWYSTNLIGNRDGMVLSQHEYAASKIADKTDVLRSSKAGFHRVAIEYCPPWGDAKEAWDAVECTTWLGAPLSIRIDWRGHDSQLAGAIILDLIRLIDRGASLGYKGFQPQLGFFFKRSFLREETTISERWTELLTTYVG